MMIVFSLLVLVKGGELIAMLSQIPEFADYIPIGCAFVICSCASLSATTAPSLSLEGKAFSQLKSMPIGAKDIYAAKIAANLIITMPGVIVSGSITQFVCEMDVLSRLTLFLLPASVQLFTAVFGMLCNVWFPRFEWVNETMVVKQSVSVLISILGGLAVLLLPCALYIGIFFGFISATVFALAFAALMVIVSAFIWHLLCTRGAKKYLAMT